jgi:hypothetical protein
MTYDMDDVLGTIPVAMSDGSSRRMTISAYVEYVAEAQRKHYAGLLENVREQLENMGLDDFTRSYLIIEQRHTSIETTSATCAS